jgi:mannosyltransferase
MTTVDEKARKEEDEYWAKWDPEKENGVGCRCRCDTDIQEVENKEGSCKSFMRSQVHAHVGAY